jgi:hypothetical protein
VNDSDDVAWLEAMVWPGDQDRCYRFRQVLAIRRRTLLPAG